MSAIDDILYAPIEPDLPIIVDKGIIKFDAACFYAPYVPLFRFPIELIETGTNFERLIGKVFK